MTAADKGKDRPYQSRDGLVALVISKIHVHPLTAVREMTANSRDEYSDLPDVDPKILIEIDAARRRFYHTDYASGIKDVEDFCYVGNESPEGMGKKVGKRVNAPDIIDPEIGGQYHIAKMSYVDCSNAEQDKVRVYSNNGTDGDILTMRQFGWGDPEHFRHERRTIALPHVGLKIEVLDAKDALLNTKKVIAYEAEKFGILIARKKLDILVREKGYGGSADKLYRVTKPSWLKTDNEVKIDPLLRLKSGRYISCRLEHTAKPTTGDNIYVFVKYVGICSIHVDYLVSGWINCDALTNAIDLSRDRLISSSEIVKEVLEKLDIYLEKEGYIKQTKGTGDKWKPTKQINELASLALKTVLKQIDINDLTGSSEDELPEGATTETGDKVPIDIEIEKRKKGVEPPETPEEPKTEEEEKDDNEEKRPRKPKVTKKVKKWVDSEEREPNVHIITRREKNNPTMFYNPDNLEELILNIDQDDAKMITGVGKGTAAITTIPFIAEATADLIAKERSLTTEGWKEEYHKLRQILWNNS